MDEEACRFARKMIEPMLRAFRQEVSEQRNGGASEADIEAMLARIEALLAFDIDAKLPKITAPVLVSASADDMLVPVTCSKRLAERLPNATLDITPWGGHAMSVTDPSCS